MEDHAVSTRCPEDPLVSTLLSTATQWISNCVSTVDSRVYLTRNVSVEDVAMTTTKTPTLDPYATGKLTLTALASQLQIVLLKVLLVYSPTNVQRKDGAGTAVLYRIVSQELN